MTPTYSTGQDRSVAYGDTSPNLAPLEGKETGGLARLVTGRRPSSCDA
ncbi:MAG: hypothetical protein ACLFWH_05685 [Actinomycetota bacterium]